jgi:hypothetical protein
MHIHPRYKGKYYNIPASKINPKPIQKPIPVYLGGFTPNTFSRIIKYYLNGWLGVVGGPLEYIENSIKSKEDKQVESIRMLTIFKSSWGHLPMS